MEEVTIKLTREDADLLLAILSVAASDSENTYLPSTLNQR